MKLWLATATHNFMWLKKLTFVQFETKNLQILMFKYAFYSQ